MADFIQTDTAPTCTDADVTVGCSGRNKSTTVTGLDSISASVGGSVGSAQVQTSMAINEANAVFFNVDYGAMPSGFNGVDAGTATINLNVTTGFGGTPSITELHLCRFDSSCVNQETVASLTGQTTAINGIGVKTFNITISARVAFGATDRLVLVVVGTNASTMAAAGGQFTPDQTDTIPLYSNAATNKGGRFIADIPLSQYG